MTFTTESRDFLNSINVNTSDRLDLIEALSILTPAVEQERNRVETATRRNIKTKDGRPALLCNIERIKAAMIAREMRIPAHYA